MLDKLLVIILYIIVIPLFLITIPFYQVYRAILFIRKRYWLYKNNLLKFLPIAKDGEFITWDFLLNPSNSTIVDLDYAKDYLNKFKNKIPLLIAPEKDNLYDFLESISNLKSLVVLKYKGPSNSSIGVEGILFVDSESKGQIKFLATGLIPSIRNMDIKR